MKINYFKFPITKTLIFLNILVMLGFMFHFKSTSVPAPSLVEWGGIYRGASWWTIGSAMFLHANLFHLLMNMFALYTYGQDLEKVFKKFYLPLYLFSGALGGLFVLLFASPQAVTIGASGAISGLVGARIVTHYVGPKLIKTNVKGSFIDAALLIGLSFLPFVSGLSHIFGLIGGVVFSYIYFKWNKNRIMKIVKELEAS